MLIGLLENGNRRLEFSDHTRQITKKEWKEMFIGNTLYLIKTNVLTEEEFQELYKNIEAKKTSTNYGLMQINNQILKHS